ncbi:hypothetical protein TNCV_4007991 [Trichonephila clavipes]|nr:hypothetical protein TNCV_4007991 [Trichonephila clavipes]
MADYEQLLTEFINHRKQVSLFSAATCRQISIAAGFFYMPYNHTTWPLSIFCIMKIHRLGPGWNPQPRLQKTSDKPTTPSSRRISKHNTRQTMNRYDKEQYENHTVSRRAA